MMSKPEIEIDFNPAELIGKIKNGTDKAVEIITGEFVKDANYYCRQDSGELKQSALISSDYKNGIALWNKDYAAKVYYKGKPSLDENPNARLEWARVASEKHKDRYLTMAKKLTDQEL